MLIDLSDFELRDEFCNWDDPSDYEDEEEHVPYDRSWDWMENPCMDE